MARVNAQEYQEKHARNLKNSQQDIVRGINRVTVAPTQLAIKKIDKMRENFVKAIDSGKTQRGLARVTLQEWQSKTIEKGVPRIAAGIDGAKDKVIAFADQLLPHIDKGKAAISNMGDTSLEDNIQRMVTFTRHMAQFKRT